MARPRRPPSGWPPVVAGLGFGGVGLALLWAGATKRLEAPPLFVAAFAAAFGGGGILVGVQGWRSARRAARRAMHPDEPWRFDRRWDPGGALDETGARARQALGQAIALAVFLLPFHAFAALDPEAFPTLALAAIDLGPLALLAHFAWLRMRRRKYGMSRLRFHRFPYFLGEPFVATLELGPRAPLVRALEVTLLCVERRLLGQAASDRGARATDVELYRATQVARGARGLPVRFELPSEARSIGTDLDEMAPRCWWLRVRGRATGIGYDAAFLLPIYAPPREGAGERGRLSR